MELLGRDSELAELTALWGQAVRGQPQLAVVWGRRRVGKTFLLTHFAEGKRAVYFTATRQDTEESQLARLADRIRDQLGPHGATPLPGPPANWEAALGFLASLARDEPLLVVIDEAPRLLSARGDFGDVVSAMWENRVRDHKLMLVLSGSAVTIIEEMLGPRGGVHRRATFERRLDPFPLRAARVFLPDLPAEDFIKAYASCGGYPLHLRQWDPGSSADDNVAQLAFSPGGLLLRDALDILSEDLDRRGGYERVLAAIGGGARTRSRIAGRAQQRIDYTLDRLRNAGYVRAIRPLGEPAADPVYEVSDDYLAFWLDVLREDADLIEGGQGRAVWLRARQRWQRHLGRVFERAAREHALSLVESDRFPPSTVVGRWWRGEVCEVDVLGLDGRQSVLVGECRWQAGPATPRDIADLRRKAAHVPEPADRLTLAFWTRTTPAEPVRDADVLLFSAADAVDG